MLMYMCASVYIYVYGFIYMYIFIYVGVSCRNISVATDMNRGQLQDDGWHYTTYTRRCKTNNSFVSIHTNDLPCL